MAASEREGPDQTQAQLNQSELTLEEFTTQLRERQAVLEQREGAVGERETQVEERERAVDEREQRLNDLEQLLDSRARAVGLDRSEAALPRVTERSNRQQEEFVRKAGSGSRVDANTGTVTTSAAAFLREQVRAERQRFAAGAAHLADVEEQLARTYERLATRKPDEEAKHRQTAHEARAAAQKIRAVADKFHSRPPASTTGRDGIWK